jgi:hypothetical protein
VSLTPAIVLLAASVLLLAANLVSLARVAGVAWGDLHRGSLGGRLSPDAALAA